MKKCIALIITGVTKKISQRLQIFDKIIRKIFKFFTNNLNYIHQEKEV